MRGISWLLAFGLAFLLESTYSTVADEDACCDKIDEMKNLMDEMKSEIHQLYKDSRRNMVLGGSYCPPGFVYLPKADSCYKVVHDARRSWSSASQKCQDLFDGAHLAVITSEQESKAVNWLIRSELSNNPHMQCGAHSNWNKWFWTAGQRNDTLCSSNFVWSLPENSRIPMTYTNWLQGEPNCRTNEHCVHIWPDRQYHWNDQDCASEICAICEYNYEECSQESDETREDELIQTTRAPEAVISN